MVPRQLGNAEFIERATDQLDHRLESQFIPRPQIQDPFFFLLRRGLAMKHCPTPIKKALSQRFREVEIFKLRRAQGQDEQNKLQVRDSGMVDIECRHIAITE